MAAFLQHMKFYSNSINLQSKLSIIQGMFARERKKNPNTLNSTSTEMNEETFHQQLENELTPDKYKAWVEFVDDKYKSAIENHYSGYASITKPLLENHKISEMFSVTEADFPHLKAFLNVCMSGRSIDDAWLKIKRQTILHHFLALLCPLHNNHKLIHWALVEAMANYGSGVPQVSKRSPCNRNFNRVPY